MSIYAKSIKLPSRRPGGGENVSSSSGSEDSTSSLEPRINLVLVDSAGKPIYRDLLPQYVSIKKGKLSLLIFYILFTENEMNERSSDLKAEFRKVFSFRPIYTLCPQ